VTRSPDGLRDPKLPGAVLLDRDGVLTEPVPDPLTGTLESPLHPADVRLVPGAAQAAGKLVARGIPVIVVSNQPSAAKGTVPLEELLAVHDRAVELLAAEGVTLDGWEYCFHHPDGVVPELTAECDCRKPSPGLFLRALAALELPASEAWMVGDADRDVLAGKRAGTKTALIEHPGSAHRREEPGEDGRPDARAASLHEFVTWLLATAPAS
jgi:D-glycero-D-manno-heptose 1,7-bisphosphate phosphatase